MKNGDKDSGLSLWEWWKDSLALSAAILILFAILDAALARFCGYEHHIQSIVSQLHLELPVVIFVILAAIFVPAVVIQRLTMKWTERRKRNVGLWLAILAIINIIILFVATLICGPQGTWTSVAAGVLLILFSSGRSMFLQKQPQQREEPSSKAKETVKTPSARKPERAKIIDLAALLVLLLAIALTRKKPK